MQYANINRSGLTAIVMCAFASGCVIGDRAVYGVSWAEQVKVDSGACPVIDGEYQNAGERFSKAKHDTYERTTVSLAHLLNGGFSAEWHQADDRLGRTSLYPAADAFQTVSLRLAEGDLRIEASLTDGSTRTFNLPTRQRCRDSTLLLEASWDSDDGVAIVRFALALGRAADGSLLVRDSESGVGFFLLPVVAGTFAYWTIFPPVAPAPAQLPLLTP